MPQVGRRCDEAETRCAGGQAALPRQTTNSTMSATLQSCLRRAFGDAETISLSCQRLNMRQGTEVLAPRDCRPQCALPPALPSSARRRTCQRHPAAAQRLRSSVKMAPEFPQTVDLGTRPWVCSLMKIAMDCNADAGKAGAAGGTKSFTQHQQDWQARRERRQAVRRRCSQAGHCRPCQLPCCATGTQQAEQPGHTATEDAGVIPQLGGTAAQRSSGSG